MKTRKQTKQGISLIVLVITIIVMIILAAAVILSLTSNGLIDRANEAVKETNLAQVKTIAQTIWSEVYLENLDKPQSQKLDYQTEVIKRLNAQKIDISKFDIVADGSGVTVTEKAEGTWVTLYENNIPTTNYMLQVSDTNIFTANARYRITIEGLGEVETTAVYAGINEGVPMYGLFGIDKGRLISIESAEDAEEKMQAASEDAVLAIGAFSIDNSISICGIMFDNATTEYTVTKIEILAIERFKGEFSLTGGWKEIKGLNIEKSYYIVYEYEEQEYAAVTFAVTGTNMIPGVLGYPIIEIRNGVIIGSEEINIKELHELRDNGLLYSEAGFTVWLGEGGGTLVGTPNTEYIIPSEVKGHIITKVWSDSINGIPTFDRAIQFGFYDLPFLLVDKIVITTIDLDFIKYYIDEYSSVKEIDLSSLRQ